ncbi:MAG: hypothetical protein Q9162_000049 [Coniocarpon cinnabarinum]
MLASTLTSILLLTLASAQDSSSSDARSSSSTPASPGSDNNTPNSAPLTQAAVGPVPTSDNANPTPVIPSTYLPIMIPTGTTLHASVVTAAPDGNQLVMAVQCADSICAGDPPATASFSLDTDAGTGSYTFAWTAKNDPKNSTSYGCALTTDLQKNVDCTVAGPSGITVTDSQGSGIEHDWR